LQDRLWAPWRAQYLQGEAGEVGGGGRCFLCRAIASTEDRSNLLVWRRVHSVVVLNRFPYNNGHLLVAPRAHLGLLTDLEGSDLVEPVETVKCMIAILDRVLCSQGYNIGLNLGRAAGAGLPGHLHWHVVPRWDGDTNFMPVLGNTKVIAESLLEFYDRLVAEIPASPDYSLAP
jgi:ATP adenylyltransferase